MLLAPLVLGAGLIVGDARARGVERVAPSEPVLVQPGPDATEVVWLEDQMCFCEWQHRLPPAEDHFRAVRGVPVRVRDDFGRNTVQGVEDETF